MERDHGSADFDALVGELGLIRAKGLVQLRWLSVPVLWDVAQDLGYASMPGWSPSAIEALLRRAVGRLGGGVLGNAAEYSFGLVQGTRGWPAQDRRRHAAQIYGVSVERFRKHQEKTIINQVAEQIIALSDQAATSTGLVQGYHGTTSAAAKAILTDGFKISRNKFDWLGDGIYFFQDSQSRAKEWARDHCGPAWAVIRAEIDLSGCMDLLDRSWFEFITEAHDLYVQKQRALGLPLPRQVGLAHGMDREVINGAAGVLAKRGVHIRSVRAVFREGRPAFPGSALFDLAHIQVAVRDITALHSTELVLEGDDYS